MPTNEAACCLNCAFLRGDPNHYDASCAQGNDLVEHGGLDLVRCFLYRPNDENPTVEKPQDVPEVLARMRRALASGDTVAMGRTIARCNLVSRDSMEVFADELEAAYNREINQRIKIDDSCVSQCALMLDDHIKAIIQDAKRRANNG